MVEDCRRRSGGSVVNGIPVYFVQDIETSYYPDGPAAGTRCSRTYRPEFRLHDDFVLEPRPSGGVGF